MHLKLFPALLCIVLCWFSAYSAPVISLNVTIPSKSPETPGAICATRDGLFVIAGTSSDSVSMTKNGFLKRINNQGIVTGGYTFSGAGDQELIAVVQSFDGNFVTAGYTSNGTYGGDDWVIMKIDTLGNRLWYRDLGFSGSDRPTSMIQTADSGFIAAGYTTKANGDTTGSLVKLDKNGNTQWYRIYENSPWASIYSIKQTNDGGYILAGGVKGNNAWHGGIDAYLFKIDSTGRQIWYKPYGGRGDEIAYSVDCTLDGGYIFAGSTTSFGNGLEDAFVVKTDSVGNRVWHKTFGGGGAG